MKINGFYNKSILPALLMFPMVNLGLTFWEYNSGNPTITNTDVSLFLEEAALLIFVAIAEELFFRGLLLCELLFSFQVNPILAGTIVSALFGALHLINVFSYASLSYAIVQSMCAFAISFDLSAIYYKFKSIVPCIVIHALINITSIGLDNGLEKLSLNSFEATVFLIVAVLYLVYGYRLFSVKQFCIDKGEDE